jgi:two-component system cell cycle sensor histidine kinase/response regulator CckA
MSGPAAGRAARAGAGANLALSMSGQMSPMGEEPGAPIVGGVETVLIVEDDRNVLEFTALALREAGYTVLEATNPGGALALGERRAGQIALLLTDLIMPEVNGFQLAELMEKENPGMRVLFMTGYLGEAAVAKGLDPLPDEILAKPFTLDELLRRVRQTLDRPAET